MMRSNQPTVRNPILALPAAAKIAALPAPTRAALCEILQELSGDARARADLSWRRHKAPMAVYWKSIAVYARHIAQACRDRNTGDR